MQTDIGQYREGTFPEKVTVQNIKINLWEKLYCVNHQKLGIVKGGFNLAWLGGTFVAYASK